MTVRSTLSPVWFDTTTDPVMPTFDAAGGCFQSSVKADGTSIVKLTASLAAGPAESVTATLKLKLPAVVGTPEITPTLGSSINPGGNGPEPSAIRQL